jgi:hypothetical protein
MAMKLASTILLIGGLAVMAETEERLDKRFNAEPGGKLVVDVDFGSVEVTTSQSREVKVDVFRKVKRGGKADEEAFLKDRPVNFSQDGKTITIQSRAPARNSWRGSQRTEGKYIISVPAEFNAQIKTSGGNITITDLRGEVKAKTSGGSLKFTGVRGPLEANTSGGDIRAADCDGPLALNTSGGNINIDNAKARIDASTSGGNVSAQLAGPLSDEVTLKTSGGNVTLRVPDKSAFDLDASTSGGNVSSDLPVQIDGKPKRTHLKGPVNGGGKSVVLRTSGGDVHVKKI